MKLISLLVLFLSFSLLADDEPRHMVVINESGFGAHGAYEDFRPRSGSLFDNYDIINGNIALNYAYRIGRLWQLGGFFVNRVEERVIETKDNRNGRTKDHNLKVGLTGIYNFDENLSEAWYVGTSLVYYNMEEEYDKEIQDFLEDDRRAQSVEVQIGKRLSLEKRGLKNITYSPAITFFTANSEKDYKDDKIELSYGVKLDLIKFDVLF